MKFAQVLEYIENCPKDPLEKLFFDYSLMKQDDINIDKLLLTDLEYVFFAKQVLSVADDEVFHIDTECPRCGNNVHADIHLSNIKFSRLDEKLIDGLVVDFADKKYLVSVPTVGKFMTVFNKYRLYRRVTDLRLIKLISLFEVENAELNRLENLIINATRAEIKELYLLEQLFLNTVEPVKIVCDHCALHHTPTIYELDTKAEELVVKVEDLSINDLNSIRLNYGGIEA
jgi:hypothetical protein